MHYYTVNQRKCYVPRKQHPRTMPAAELIAHEPPPQPSRARLHITTRKLVSIGAQTRQEEFIQGWVPNSASPRLYAHPRTRPKEDIATAPEPNVESAYKVERSVQQILSSARKLIFLDLALFTTAVEACFWLCWCCRRRCLLRFFLPRVSWTRRSLQTL